VGTLGACEDAGLDGGLREDAGLDGWFILSIAAGSGFTCARGDIRAGAGVQCWGDNRDGQLGDGTRERRTTPRRVVGLGYVQQVVAGAAHACAILEDHSVRCWGRNANGQLGDGTRISRETPVPVIGLPRVGQLDFGRVGRLVAGEGHTCACTRDGRVFCWGANAHGQLGDGSTTDRATPTLVEGVLGCSRGLVGIAAGGEHTCVMSDGITPTVCWGRNDHGQLGDGTTEDRLVPVRGTTRQFSASIIAAGAAHTCVLDAWSPLCWGRNDHGQLGDGTTEDRLAPTLTNISVGSGKFAVGASHACAFVSEPPRVDATGMLLVDESVRCWGSNAAGQLGDGTRTDRSAPVVSYRLPTSQNRVLYNFAAGSNHLAAGTDHTCVLLQSAGERRCTPSLLGGSTCESDVTSTLVCWGSNQHGQFGDGTTTGQNAPTVVRRWEARGYEF
jgi:alpha-tubulin suppressor-like RCC1 family protein